MQINTDYILIGNLLYSNQTELLATYIFNVDEVNLPPHFVKSLEYALASDFAISVTEDTKKAVDGGTLEIIDWLDKPIDQTRLLAVINAAVRKGSTDRPRILHIEDDADVLRVVSTLLSDRAEMSQAATLREARKMLRQQHFDLVLLDLVMPDGSGTELLPLINKQTPPIPVVVFSAYEVDGATAKMVAAILIKSRTSNEQLLDAIMAVIENG